MQEETTPEQTPEEASKSSPEPAEPAAQLPPTPKPEPVTPVSEAASSTPPEQEPVQPVETVPPPVEQAPPSSTVQPPIPELAQELRAKANLKRKQRQAQKLAQIEELLSQKGRIRNREIRDLLHISQSTASMYLDVLVKQGKIKKQGRGRATIYTK